MMKKMVHRASVALVLCSLTLVLSTTNLPGTSSSTFKGIQSVSERDYQSSSSPSPDLVLLVNNKDQRSSYDDDDQPEYDYKPRRDDVSNFNTPPINQLTTIIPVRPTTTTTAEISPSTTIIGDSEASISTTTTTTTRLNNGNETTITLESSTWNANTILPTTKLPATTNFVKIDDIATTTGIAPTTTRDLEYSSSTTSVTYDTTTKEPTTIETTKKITPTTTTDVNSRITTADKSSRIPTLNSTISTTISSIPITTTTDSISTTTIPTTIQRLMARLPTTTTTESSLTTGVPNWATTTTTGSRITTPRCRNNSPKGNRPTTTTPTTTGVDEPSRFEPRKVPPKGNQKQECPRPEDIHPCECIEITSHQNPEQIETVAFCKNIRNMEVLKDAMKGMQGHFIKYFVMDSCKMPPFPNGLFHNVGVGWLEMLNSTVQFQQSYFSCTNGCW